MLFLIALILTHPRIKKYQLVGDANYLPSTTHYYEYSKSGITWSAAKVQLKVVCIMV